MTDHLKAVDVSAGFSRYQPSSQLFTVDEKLLYVQPVIEKPVRLECSDPVKPKAQLYKAEVFYIQEQAFAAAKKQLDFTELVKCGKSRYIVRQNPQDQQLAEKLEKLSRAEFTAVVTVWNGPGMPPDALYGGVDLTKEEKGLPDALKSESSGPPLTGGTWEKMYHKKEVAAELKRSFRWTSVDLFPFDAVVHQTNATGIVTPLKKKWDILTGNGKVDSEHLQLYALKVNMFTSRGSLKDFVAQSRDAANIIDASYTYDVVHALVKKDFEHGKEGKVVCHGNKFYSTQKDYVQQMQHLTYIEGTHRTLRLNGNDELVTVDGLCQKVFLPDKPVADFFCDTFGKSNFTVDNRDLMAKALTGRLVIIHSKGRKEKRVVYSISRDTATTAADDQKHHAWLSKAPGFRLLQPELPLLNVGTKYRHALIPAELCIIAPLQSFTGPFTLGLLRDLNARRRDLGVPEGGKSRLREIMYSSRFPRPATQHSEQNERLQTAFTRQPNVIFVNAGTEQLKADAWDAFTTQFRRSDIFKKCNMVVAKQEPVFLQYTPDYDPIRAWKRKLNQALEVPRDTDQPCALVIAVRDDSYSKHVYQILKYLCDTNEVGVQSFVVNLRNLSTTIRRFGPVVGAKKSANEVIRRMRMRNPAVPLDPPVNRMDIAVALHISCVSVGSLPVRVDPASSAPKQLYMAVFSSRLFDQSRTYKTKVVLVGGPDKIKQYDPSSDLMGFLDNLLSKDAACTPHRITLLRSGYMAMRNSPRDSESSKLRLAKSHAHVNVQPIDDGEDSGDTPAGASKSEMANLEYELLRKALLSRNGQPAKVSYILLHEDNNFAFSHEQKEKIAKKVGKYAVQDQNDGTTSSFFICDTVFAPDDHTLSAHRKITVTSDATKLISLTLMGDCLVDSSYDVLAELRDDSDPDSFDESGMKTPRASGTPSRAPRTPGSGRRSIRGTPRASDMRPPGRRSDAQLFDEDVKSRFDEGLGDMSTDSDRDPRNSKNTVQAQNGSDADGESLDASSPEHTPAAARTQNRQASFEIPTMDELRLSDTDDKISRIQTQITMAELRRLAVLWRDDHLELFDTKWPVPTHLAYLAAKRAILHIQYRPQDDQDDDGGAFALAEVSDNVAKTLYYM